MVLAFWIFFFIGLFFIIWQKKSNWIIYRWRKTLNLNQHQATFERLYQNINGFELSHKARIGRDAPEYVYGEIVFESFVALLSLCHPNKDTIFYDLGSGTGKAVLAAMMVFDLKESLGVEWFSLLHEGAMTQKNRLAQIELYHNKANRIQFINEDFLSLTYERATLIFINATAFFGDNWLKINQHLEAIPLKTRVITISKALTSPRFKLQKITKVSMSWGVVKAYIHEKI